MSGGQRGVLGFKMRIAGWLCVVGAVCVFLSLLGCLRELPAEWWYPQPPPSTFGSLDLRTIWVDFAGIVWVAQWGYVGALVWLPSMVVRVLRARRLDMRLSATERVQFVTLLSLVVAVSLLRYGTPLRHAHFNIILL